MGNTKNKFKIPKMKAVLVLLLVAYASSRTLFLTPTAFQAMSHYGNPTSGCRSDEIAAKIQGANGDACFPRASNNTCPTDVPQGTTASPMPVIQDQQGDRYCGLVCSGVATGTCPQGAKCLSPSSLSYGLNLQAMVGICLYPSA